jgi:hypothetical protein
MMIVVKSSSRDLLMERLRTRFYEPGNVPFGAILCRPVAGAGILAL